MNNALYSLLRNALPWPKATNPDMHIPLGSWARTRPVTIIKMQLKKNRKTPYTPRNWHTLYGVENLVTQTDSTGFLLQVSGSGADLIYKHKDGAQYPVAAVIAPYTNLAWRDYVVRDTMIVPDEDIYNDVDFGLYFYYNGPDSTYVLEFDGGSAYVNGGRFSDELVPGFTYSKGDTIITRIEVSTVSNTDIPDGRTEVDIHLAKNSGSTTLYFSEADTTVARIISGPAAVWLDLSELGEPSEAPAFTVRGASVQKQ